MKNKDVKHKARYYVKNYECGRCETGVVQLCAIQNKRGIVTTTISGCLDCGHEYGIKQAQTSLSDYTRNDLVWA